MAALTSLGVDVEAALDYGALGTGGFFDFSGMTGIFIQAMCISTITNPTILGIYGEYWGTIRVRVTLLMDLEIACPQRHS